MLINVCVSAGSSGGGMRPAGVFFLVAFILSMVAFFAKWGYNHYQKPEETVLAVVPCQAVAVAARECWGKLINGDDKKDQSGGLAGPQFSDYGAGQNSGDTYQDNL